MSNKYKILVVEDDLNICNFVKTILSTHSYQVITAHNCNSGEMMFHSHCPDLLILDLGLPDGDRSALGTFSINGLSINYDERVITLNNEEVKLTQTEYNIVQLLSIYAGRVLTYSEIIKRIWGYSDIGSIKKLQVNMANIRKKLGEKPGENRFISNELGVGYRMNSPEVS